MKHRIFSALVAVVFFVTVYTNLDWHRLVLFVGIELTGAAAYNIFYLKSQQGYYWSAIRFAMLEASVALLAVVLPEGFRFVPLTVCAFLIYFSELLIAAVSEQLLFIETLLTFFGFAMGIYAISFYFAPPSTVILGSLFVSSALAARCGFDPIPRSAKEKTFYSLLIGLCVSEIGWGLLLLPLHFTALAIIAFNAFYVLWMLSYFHFHFNITLKKILFHSAFSAALVVIALAATPLK